MIATANALLEATQQSIFDDESMEVAQMIVHTHNDLDNEELAKALFLYATIIASNSVDKTAKVLMTKDELKDLMITIDEIESMRNEVLDEN